MSSKLEQDLFISGIIKGLEIAYKQLDRNLSSFKTESEIKILSEQKLSILNQLQFWQNYKLYRNISPQDLKKYTELEKMKDLDKLLIQTNISCALDKEVGNEEINLQLDQKEESK